MGPSESRPQEILTYLPPEVLPPKRTTVLRARGELLSRMFPPAGLQTLLWLYTLRHFDDKAKHVVLIASRGRS